jgi:hypothetical protein
MLVPNARNREQARSPVGGRNHLDFFGWRLAP